MKDRSEIGMELAVIARFQKMVDGVLESQFYLVRSLIWNERYTLTCRTINSSSELEIWKPPFKTHCINWL